MILPCHSQGHSSFLTWLCLFNPTLLAGRQESYLAGVCGYVGLRLAGGMSHWQMRQSNEEDQIESQMWQAEDGKQQYQCQVGQVNKEELEPKAKNMSTWRPENRRTG